MPSLTGQVALVTGASRGIGAALAVELARRGAQCVLVARTQGGLEETDDAIRAAGGLPAALLPLDLQRRAQDIDMLGPSVVARFGRLDILAHAAGVLPKLTPVAHIQPRDIEESLAVNLTAAWRLIRTCDPPLRAAPAGRAVVLTDAVAAAPAPYWGMYGAAKAGMEHLVRCWAAEVATTPLRVMLADPGAVATGLRANAFPGQDPAAMAGPQDVAPALADLCEAAEQRHGETIRLGR
ncbi:SDR family NAD(P)-dependent oxidoreductase [Roseomonas sp. CECT 9278]|uniref:SDR family NAD(P)-dependent oxidoreductase n=1 Tax=Roseomonas sp. CECT 9278 TaxID=2845823 RepID=UPI001E4DD6B1|nr:SDR family oxidoreductase [Roseomonas sp. CECT 9278]CAH0304079.1 putative oxidoreductase YciK [Roseomonas sp. CECT 9278]